MYTTIEEIKQIREQIDLLYRVLTNPNITKDILKK